MQINSLSDLRKAVEADTEGRWNALGVLDAVERLTSATPPDVAGLIDKAVVEAIGALRVEQPGRAYDILSDALEAATALRLSAGGGWREPVAYRVHDFHVARMPVKAKGKFEPPTEYLYPANRAEDAKETARIMGATCTPLYTLPASPTVEGA